MHPIERLRHVARSGSSDPALLVSEAAGALATFAGEEIALVTACRRLVDRHVTVGPMWWLASRVLVSGDPEAEALRLLDELEDDPTARHLSEALPEEAVVTVVGWPPTIRRALSRRGDARVLAVDATGDGLHVGRRARADMVTVPPWGLGSAAASSSVVLLEATALGPTGFVAPVGSLAAAAVGSARAIPVLAVAAAGTALPAPLWSALSGRVTATLGEPWECYEELVPADLSDAVIGPEGTVDAGRASRQARCPVAPELLRPANV